MDVLAYYEDDDTRNGEKGAIDGSTIKDTWGLKLDFPHGPEHGGYYGAKIRGAERTRLFLKNVLEYFGEKATVNMVLCEQEISNKETGDKRYPLMKITITGWNRSDEEGEFSLTVMGKPGEKLLDLAGMIWQKAPTAQE